MSYNKDKEFRDLVELHYENLYRFAYSLSKTQEDASDLTQQTFLIWANKGHNLKDRSKAKSWLFTTLYREFLRIRRKHKNVSGVEPEFLESAEDTTLRSASRKLEGNEALETLQEVDEIYREPLALYYIDDLSYKEIAEVLNSPIGTVMSRLSRGKSQLKQILAEKTGNKP